MGAWNKNKRRKRKNEKIKEKSLKHKPKFPKKKNGETYQEEVEKKN